MRILELADCHGACRLVLDGKSYRAPRPLRNDPKTQLKKSPKRRKNHPV